MSSWTIITRSEEETRLLGRRLGEQMTPGLVVTLNGPLGAGKTCFAQGVAYGLGVPEQTPVTSPSYALMHVHRGRLHLYHFDLYRLTRVDDLEDLGYDEYAEGEGVTLVEWADRIGTPLTAALAIQIDYCGLEQRRILLQASSAQGESLLSGVRRTWQGQRPCKNL